jgi:DHA2 family methylenomycin A resistance protein-like MFS transporter
MQLARAGLLLASFMAVFDIAVVFVALPDMQRSIGAGIADQQWIASAYALMEAGFTLAAGTLGDRWGRRRVLVTGVVLFIAASIGSALAPTPNLLIATRFVQGIGGAILMALPLAMLVALARDDRERASAIRTFATIAGLGAVAAPVLGGALVDAFGWRSIFLVNVPLALVVLASTFAYPREPVREGAPRLDVGGQLTSAVALMGLSYAAIEGNAAGWTSVPILCAAALGIVSALAFVAIEQRSSAPMIRFSALRRPELATGAGCMFVMNLGFFTVYFLSTLFLQNVKHVSPSTAGWYLLANNLAFFVINLGSDPLVRRIGARAAGLSGMACSAAGIALFAGIDASTPAPLLMIPLILTGLAWGFAVTPFNTLAMSAALPTQAGGDETGLDAGLLNLGRPLGATIGATVFGSVIAGMMAAQLARALAPFHLAPAAAGRIAHALHHGGLWSVADGTAAIGIAPVVIRTALDDGFVAGMHRSAVITAVLTLLAVIAGWYGTRSRAARMGRP